MHMHMHIPISCACYETSLVPVQLKTSLCSWYTYLPLTQSTSIPLLKPFCSATPKCHDYRQIWGTFCYVALKKSLIGLRIMCLWYTKLMY